MLLKHLSKIPTDPSGNSYIYAISGTTAYELAAVLENDGNPANFESYIIGNSNTEILNTNTGEKYNNDISNPDLLDCPGTVAVVRGQIGADDANCVGYDPRP